MKTNLEYEPFGEEWKKEISKLPKAAIIEMLSKKGKEQDAIEMANRIIIEDYNKQVYNLKGALKFLCSKEHIEQDAYTAHIERYIKFFNL